MSEAIQAKPTFQSIRAMNRGKPPAITPAIVDTIAERVSSGLPLRMALAKHRPPIRLSHWENALAKRETLALYYEQKMADLLMPMLETIKGRNSKELPVGTCWILERRFGEYFSNKQGQTQVNVAVVQGVPEEVVKRARTFVSKQDPAAVPDKPATPSKE